MVSEKLMFWNLNPATVGPNERPLARRSIRGSGAVRLNTLSRLALVVRCLFGKTQRSSQGGSSCTGSILLHALCF